MADGMVNFLTDIHPPLAVGTLWPMRSGAMMMIREINIHATLPILGRIEGGESQNCIFYWKADGSCSNGTYMFGLRTPAERAAANQPKTSESYPDCYES